MGQAMMMTSHKRTGMNDQLVTSNLKQKGLKALDRQMLSYIVPPIMFPVHGCLGFCAPRMQYAETLKEPMLEVKQKAVLPRELRRIRASALTGDKKYISLRAAFLNPTVLSVAAGLVLYILKAKTWLPALLQDGFRTIGAMSTPLCMLILGIRLATMDFRKLFTTPLVWLIAAGKLLVFPLFCYLLVLAFPFDPVFRGSILILAATPCASILLNLAEIHHNGQELAANCALLTTLLSVATIPLLSLLL